MFLEVILQETVEAQKRGALRGGGERQENLGQPWPDFGASKSHPVWLSENSATDFLGYYLKERDVLMVMQATLGSFSRN